MRVTVCELEPLSLENAWGALCAHAAKEASELLVLPEIAFSGPLWLTGAFEPRTWQEAEAAHERWLARLPELGVGWVIGTRPVTVGSQHFNEGFLWSAASRLAPLRRKYFLPDEPGGWEARWFARGDPDFPRYAAGELSFGLNICSELWALETFGAYRSLGVDAVIAPRASAAATTEKWLALGTVAAVATGAYCLSSNRVEADGSCGGVGWVIDPDGACLARTSPGRPYCTVALDLGRVRAAAKTYPRYVFERS
jgi:N-carbamoylputrescine amidase